MAPLSIKWRAEYRFGRDPARAVQLYCKGSTIQSLVGARKLLNGVQINLPPLEFERSPVVQLVSQPGLQ